MLQFGSKITIFNNFDIFIDKTDRDFHKGILIGFIFNYFYILSSQLGEKAKGEGVSQIFNIYSCLIIFLMTQKAFFIPMNTHAGFIIA